MRGSILLHIVVCLIKFFKFIKLIESSANYTITKAHFIPSVVGPVAPSFHHM